MNRYSILKNREILLLKSKPCFWGKCAFCDYIEDNSNDALLINSINISLLKNVTGEKKALEIINSGSCFELPQETLTEIYNTIDKKNINKLYLESHFSYKNKIQNFKDYFKIPIIFKTGIETFDEDFRNRVLNKNVHFKYVEEVRNYFDSVCLMVGILGQTKDMIKKDIDILLNNFEYGAINIYTENSTPIKRDEHLIEWFKNTYSFLKDYENIDVLFENTDFGVGE